MKNKKHTTLSIDAEKHSIIPNFLSWKKHLIMLGREEMYLTIIKAMYDKPTANILLNSDRSKSFPLSSGTRRGHTL